MSVDIGFWRYKPGVSRDHEEVYYALSDGQHVDGLEDLPLPAILKRLHEVLADWKPLDEETWESDRGGAFQVFTTPQFFRVDFYGCSKLKAEDFDRIIAVLAEFGCPVYASDPNERAEQS
jgi:hypothetical protein